MLVELLLLIQASQVPAVTPEVVSFRNEQVTLHGVLYKPDTPGPHPALLYNHGSARGMLSQQAFDDIGPRFANRGWVFFAPWRRGQGLSADAGPYIGDEISSARRQGALLALAVALPAAMVLFLAFARRRPRWVQSAWGVALTSLAAAVVFLNGTRAGATEAVRLLTTDHLSDQLAGLEWLRSQDFIDKNRIAVAGNSFGGIETVLGAARADYCAAVDGSGGAESWHLSVGLQNAMARAVRESRSPVFFFQAENDYSLAPTETLSAAMKDAGKPFEKRIYPASGETAADGHNFAWAGSEVWLNDVLPFLERHCAP